MSVPSGVETSWLLPSVPAMIPINTPWSCGLRPIQNWQALFCLDTSHSIIGWNPFTSEGLIHAITVRPSAFAKSRPREAGKVAQELWPLNENDLQTFPSAKLMSVSSALWLPAESLPLSSPDQSATRPGRRAPPAPGPATVSLRSESVATSIFPKLVLRSEEHTSEL